MFILYSSLFNYNKHTINKTNDFLGYSYSALLAQFLHIIKLLPQSTGTKIDPIKIYLLSIKKRVSFKI